MTRPRYETETDIANERRVIRIFTANLGGPRSVIEPVKLDDRHAADYMLLKMGQDDHGTRVGFVEIKTRNFAFGTFNTHYIAELKWRKLIGMVELGFDVFAIFALTDATYWYKLTGVETVEIKVAGRTDRGDPRDTEPIVHVPAKWFTKLRY